MDDMKQHQQRAAPGHKTRAGLTCMCGRAFGTEQELNVHQLKPWFSDAQCASWNGNPDR